MDLLAIALLVTGLGTLGLGVVHVVLPRIVDVDGAIPPDGPPLRPLPIVRGRYATRRQDVKGVIWVSNNAASYVLLTLGIADLAAPLWLGTDAGRLLALWATGWWVVRAVSQLSFGRRPGDLAFMTLFTLAGIVHLLAAAR